jgi:hypothetical protein
MKILLDYFFPITTIEPTPEASTAFLKQVLVVATPKSGQEGNVGTIYECTTMSAVSTRTDNTEAQQLFDAGMNKVFVLLADDLYLAEFLEGHESDFYTILISSDFDKDDINATAATLTINGDLTFTAVDTGSPGNSITITLADTVTAGSETVVVDGTDITINIESGQSTATQIKAAFDASDDATELASCSIVSGQDSAAQAAASEAPLAGGDGLFLGEFEGVVGVSSTDDSFLATQAAIANRCAFHTTTTNKAKNMFYAFGKLLSNSLSWLNQQYISMPVADDVDTVGAAESLFDDKISFVISDDEFGERLALFAAGAKAIVAPYIKKNLEIDLQSSALSYISGNQPPYTKKHAALLEDELQKVIQSYIDAQEIELGTAEVKLEQSNFVASGYFNISEPNALWRIEGEMRQTL